MDRSELIAFQTACRAAISQLTAGGLRAEPSDMHSAWVDIGFALQVYRDCDGYSGDASVADAYLRSAGDWLGRVRSPASAVPQGEPLKPSTATMPANVRSAISYIAQAREVLAPHRPADTI